MPPAGQPLTVFGATLLTLMIRRGITTWTELSRLLAHHGYHFSRGSFSPWAYGRSAAPKTLPPALREVLKLDEEEAVELAMSFAYGQDERITLEPPDDSN